MKKFIAGFICLAMLATLFAGCSSSGSSSSPAPAADSASGSQDSAGPAADAAAGSDYADREIVFADVGWDSIRLHNNVAGFIAENAFGYKGFSEMTGTTAIIHEGVLNGEIDVHMENWIDTLAYYIPDREAGKFQEMGINFDDNKQGFYVPRYVIEGDPERGIEPMAPELRTVKDLLNYADVFPDEEKPGRGRIYGSIPGWLIDEILHKKYLLYGLDESYEYFSPGSDAAMNATISNAYEKGEAIVAYHWEPTWLLGKYDYVLLEDEPYTNEEDYHAGKTECPSTKVMMITSNNFAENNPEFCDFLRKYHSTSGAISDTLAYMMESGVDHYEAAQYYLRQNDAWLDEWLSPEQAQLVRDALKQG